MVDGVMGMLFQPKVAQRDFQASSLPATRKEVFFDVVRLQWPKLLVLGLITLAFSLPLIGTQILRSQAEAGAYAAAMERADGEGMALVQLSVLSTVLSGVDILLYGLLGVGLSGVGHIIKKLAWEEPVEVSKALVDGLRQNAKQYLLLGLLTGAGVFLVRYIITSSQTLFGYLAVALGFLLAPVGLYMMVTIVVYDIPFLQQIRYGLLTYGKNFGKTLLTCGCCCLPLLAEKAAGLLWGTAAGAVVAAVIRLGLPFLLLGWFLWAYICLDKAINEKYYPELVSRGLNLVSYEDDSSWME